MKNVNPNSIPVLSVLVILLMSFLFWGYSTGITGRTNKGPDPGCTCHGGSPTPGVSAIISGPSTIAPGATATYTVTITGGPLVRAGVNIATSSGSLAPVSGSGLVLEGDELKHSSPKSPSGGAVTFSFDYTAPNSVGTQTLYATANSVNFNGNSSGDEWNHAPNFTVNVSSSPVIDGDLSDAFYTTIATKQNTNSGFGSAIDVKKIVYYPDYTNNILYLGVEGKLDVTNNNGIGIWLNVSGAGSPSGTPAGNALGGIQPEGGHYIGTSSNTNFRADFEVDYLFAINPGNSSTNCYVDAASRIVTPARVYLGNCGQSGTSIDYSTTGTVFQDGYTITFAFNNSGASNKGFEIKIPFGAIGANSSHNIEVFAFVVSSTAYFSDVTVPGNVSGGNLGFNPNFNSISGGPYHSNSQPLPVTLTSFNAFLIGDKVHLNWSTATETNNYGFEIERVKGDPNTNKFAHWEKIGFVQGNGNSNSVKIYSFEDKNVLTGQYAYRLKQINYDGSYEYSDVVKVDVKFKPSVMDVKNFPNPFNPTTKVRYEIPYDGLTLVKVYDILGNEITTLINEYKDAGIYEAELDGSKLSNGIYLIKLQVGNFTKVTKAILMK